MAKKKFKDTTLGRILIGAAGVISPSLGSLLSGAKSPGEALLSIRESDISPEDKAKLESLYVEQQITEDQEITKRWTSDNQASPLTRYIRPLTLIFLTCMLTFFTYLDSAEGIQFHVEDKWVSLWSLAYITFVTAYAGGKSIEKTFRK